MCQKCKGIALKYADYVFCPYCGNQLNTLFSVSKKDDFQTIILQFTNNPGTISAVKLFIDMRIKKKKRPTAHALQIILNRVYKQWGYTDEQAYRAFMKSAVNSWTDIYQLKEETKEENGSISIMKNQTDYSDIYSIYE